MKRCLPYLSLLLGICAACSSIRPVGEEGRAFIPFWTPQLADTLQTNRFRLLLSTPGSDLTGLFMAKRMEGTWRGSVVNEFGVKIFDFISTEKGCRLMNVIYFLDKWYIRRAIASDIRYIMEVDNPTFAAGAQSVRYRSGDTLTVARKKTRRLRLLPHGEIIYENVKHAVTCSLTKLYDTEK